MTLRAAWYGFGESHEVLIAAPPTFHQVCFDPIELRQLWIPHEEVHGCELSEREEMPFAVVRREPVEKDVAAPRTEQTDILAVDAPALAGIRLRVRRLRKYRRQPLLMRTACSCHTSPEGTRRIPSDPWRDGARPRTI